jgi:hypothetical protein
MPRISSFHGIVILMFANEGVHQLPHFHAQYAEHYASLALDGTLIVGSLPAAQLRLVRTWAELHRGELLANWERIGQGQRVEGIDPLA